MGSKDTLTGDKQADNSIANWPYLPEYLNSTYEKLTNESVEKAEQLDSLRKELQTAAQEISELKNNAENNLLNRHGCFPRAACS